MKIINCISLIFFATLISCNSDVVKTKLQASLVGKVYQSSDGMDSLCKIMEKGTDHFQRLFFINDSLFVKAVSTCCGDDGDDENDTTYWLSDWYYSGIYKLNDKELSLTYNPQMVDFYMNNSNPKLTYLKMEKLDLTNSKLERMNCNDIPYFKQTDEEFSGRNEFVCPTEDTLEKYKKELVENGVWEKLFK